MVRTLVSILIVVFGVAVIQARPPNVHKQERVPYKIHSRRTLATIAVSDALANEQAKPEEGIAEVTQELKDEGLNNGAEIVSAAADAAQKVTEVLAKEMSDNTAVAVADAVSEILSEKAKLSEEEKPLEEQPTRRNLNSNMNINNNRNYYHNHHKHKKVITYPTPISMKNIYDKNDVDHDDIDDDDDDDDNDDDDDAHEEINIDDSEEDNGNDSLDEDDEYGDDSNDDDDYGESKEDDIEEGLHKPKDNPRRPHGGKGSMNTNRNSNHNTNMNLKKGNLFRRSFGVRQRNINRNANINFNNNGHRHHYRPRPRPIYY